MFQIKHWTEENPECLKHKDSISAINIIIKNLEKGLGSTIPTKKQIDDQFNLMLYSHKGIDIQQAEHIFSKEFSFLNNSDIHHETRLKQQILKHKSDIKSLRSNLLNKMIEFVSNNLNESRLREHFCQDIGWTLVSEASLQFIEGICLGYQTVSIGSGKAYIESLLDANITCFDISISESSFKEVLDITKEKPKWGSYDILFLCWPHFKDSIASDSLLNFVGNHLIYIGEESGGCTGNPEFFDLLSTNWNLQNYIELPNWSGIYSELYYYTRKV